MSRDPTRLSSRLPSHRPSPARADPAIRPVVAAGLVALAVAMGIGRFAFTPLMPLMIRDGSLEPAVGAEWAAANYVGYLVGALTAAWFSADPRRGLRLGLAGVALTTLAMAGLGALPDFLPSALPGAAMRGAAGVFSAWALVCASGWCLAELARRRAEAMGAWIYTGVGLGIALAGILAWLGGRQPADRLWLELGLIAALGAWLVWRFSRGPSEAADAPRAPMSPVERRSGQAALVVCYGAFGFGYIVPATFLPAMARALTPDPLVFGLAWPLFGLAAALSVAGVARWLARAPRRRVWAVAQGIMALGNGLPLLVPSLWSVAASAVLVGGTFMVATMAGLQLAREARAHDPTALIARMTAAFAAGQIAGPLMVRVLGPPDGSALAWTGAAATLVLVGTAVWLWREA